VRDIAGLSFCHRAYPEAHRDVIRDYYRDLSKKAAKIRNP